MEELIIWDKGTLHRRKKDLYSRQTPETAKATRIRRVTSLETDVRIGFRVGNEDKENNWTKIVLGEI